MADPQGYYAALGVAEGADAETLKAAWRERARLLHPDLNPGAADAFHAAREAWQVLSDPIRRARYDAGDAAETPPEPAACDRCHRVTAQPRFVVFHRVRSAFLFTRRTAVEGVLCRDCADATALIASGRTWIEGWWAPAGPFVSLAALIGNLFGGDQPRPQNYRLLLRQAGAFLERGDHALARALASHAAGFAANQAERRRALTLRDAAPDTGQRLKDRWKPLGKAFWLQLLPLLTLPAVVAWIVLLLR